MNPKFFIPAYLTLALSSCGPGTDYEIILQQQGHMIVQLETKVEPTELREIAWYNYDDMKLEDGTFMMTFCVPSAYPEYPETPWAMVWIMREADAEQTEHISLKIYGTRNEEEKKNLMAIQPDTEGIAGKWYFQEPLLESVYFLIEKPSDTLMLIFRADDYEEYDGEQLPVILRKEYYGRNEVDQILPLHALARPGEYAEEDFSEATYKINAQGELILLNHRKSYLDTTHPILQPIPF